MKLLVIILTIAFSSIDGFAQNGWRYLNSGVSKNLKSVEFATENFGIVVGDSGTALKTVDGGQSWEQMNFPNEIEPFKTTFNAVAFADESTAIIVGKQILDSNRISPLILRSDNNGQTWQNLSSFVEGYFDLNKHETSFVKICMSTKAEGFITLTSYLNGSAIFRTKDAGRTWILYKDYKYYDIEQIDCSKENSFIISVRTHARYHGTEYGNINTIVENPDKNIINKFSNTDVSNWYGTFRVQSIGQNSWLSLQLDGAIKDVLWRSVDDGITWSLVNNSFPDIYAIFFNNSPIGYGISIDENGRNRLILKTKDGGNTWVSQKYPENSLSISDIFIVNDTLAYAVGAKGTILKVTDDATSVEDNQPELLKEITAYPNPATGEFTIQGGSGELMLINSLGKVVWRGFKSEEKLKIDVSDFPQGIYVLKHNSGAQMISIVR